MAAVLRTLSQQLTAANTHISKVVQHLRDGDFPTEKGLSILEVKNQMLTMYLLDLAQVIQQKVNGETLREEPAVMRLIEIRTVLEKMRPIDQKLRYQIDKLVKTVLTGSLSVGDPLTFKPNPTGLVSQLADDEQAAMEVAMLPAVKEPGLNPRKVYVPPRLVPMHYHDQTNLEKEQKRLERIRKRALGSSVIRELQEQYTDEPEEQCEGRLYHSMRYNREEKHRTQYEEMMMTRVNVSKVERTWRKRALAMTSQLGSLTHFVNIDALTGEGKDMDSVPKKKKKKSEKKTKKKKKGFHRRR